MQEAIRLHQPLARRWHNRTVKRSRLSYMAEIEKTILVVDDLEANRYVVCRILRSANYKTLEAATGRNAIKLALQFHPDAIIFGYEHAWSNRPHDVGTVAGRRRNGINSRHLSQRYRTGTFG